MIPHAIASTSVYADLWSQLKSMDHALLRAQSATSAKDIADLDKARLGALAAFLKNELEATESVQDLSLQAFLALRPTEPRYSLDADLREMLNELPSFKQWLKTQRLSFREKTAKLASALVDYVEKVSTTLIATPPGEEFTILHELLTKLLSHIESALVI